MSCNLDVELHRNVCSMCCNFKHFIDNNSQVGLKGNSSAVRQQWSVAYCYIPEISVKKQEYCSLFCITGSKLPNIPLGHLFDHSSYALPLM